MGLNYIIQSSPQSYFAPPNVCSLQWHDEWEFCLRYKPETQPQLKVREQWVSALSHKKWLLCCHSPDSKHHPRAPGLRAFVGEWKPRSGPSRALGYRLNPLLTPLKVFTLMQRRLRYMISIAQSFCRMEGRRVTLRGNNITFPTSIQSFLCLDNINLKEPQGRGKAKGRQGREGEESLKL